MQEQRQLIADSANKLFADTVSQQLIEQMEAGQWPAELWDALVAADFHRSAVPVDMDGPGTTWLDVFEIMLAAGRHAAPVPLAETIATLHFASALNLPLPASDSATPATLLPGACQQEGSQDASNADVTTQQTAPEGAHYEQGRIVSWAASPQIGQPIHVLNVQGQPGKDGNQSPASPTGEWIDPATLGEVFRGTEGAPHRTLGARYQPIANERQSPSQSLLTDPVLLLGSLLNSAQMAGALETALNLCCDYTGTREQFGRPIAKFQAVQHMAAQLAAETQVARTAAEVAFAALENAGDASSMQNILAAAKSIAWARVTTDRAAAQGAALAHQIHGAIGFSREYALNYLTRRMWSWRTLYGTPGEWAAAAGQQASAAVQRQAQQSGQISGGVWHHITNSQLTCSAHRLLIRPCRVGQRRPRPHPPAGIDIDSSPPGKPHGDPRRRWLPFANNGRQNLLAAILMKAGVPIKALQVSHQALAAHACSSQADVHSSPIGLAGHRAHGPKAVPPPSASPWPRRRRHAQ